MSLHRNSEISRAATAGTALLFAFLYVGMSHFALAEEAEPAPIEAVDEIVVYGDKSLHLLRNVVLQTQENFFAVFSSFNDEDEYDIRCFYETPTGTRIRTHVCRAYFVTNATSADAKQWMTAGARYPVADAKSVILLKKRRLREKMEALVSEHPELLQALGEYTEAKQTLKSERQRKCADRTIVCSQ